MLREAECGPDDRLHRRFDPAPHLKLVAGYPHLVDYQVGAPLGREPPPHRDKARPRDPPVHVGDEVLLLHLHHQDDLAVMAWGEGPYRPDVVCTRVRWRFCRQQRHPRIVLLHDHQVGQGGVVKVVPIGYDVSDLAVLAYPFGLSLLRVGALVRLEAEDHAVYVEIVEQTNAVSSHIKPYVHSDDLEVSIQFFLPIIQTNLSKRAISTFFIIELESV